MHMRTAHGKEVGKLRVMYGDVAQRGSRNFDFALLHRELALFIGGRMNENLLGVVGMPRSCSITG